MVLTLVSRIWVKEEDEEEWRTDVQSQCFTTFRGAFVLFYHLCIVKFVLYLKLISMVTFLLLFEGSFKRIKNVKNLYKRGR